VKGGIFLGDIHIAHIFINYGIFMGFCAGAMVLLRPILCRVFTAQQRVILWYFCFGFNFLSMNNKTGCRTMFPSLQLPVFLRDLITNQTWKESETMLGNRYYADLSEVPYLDAIYLLSLLLILLWLVRRSEIPDRYKERGIEIPKEDPFLQSVHVRWIDHVYVVEDMPTSFVDSWNDIYLQKVHSPQRMYQIFLHEAEHVRLRHTYIKAGFTFLLGIYWWNPLLWLGFRYMVRDMELACDSAVLSKLKPEGRTEYAKTLVELGCGRQLWTRPTCFGECDAEIRVKAVLKWKPQNRLLNIVRYALMAVVIWFFVG